MGHRHVFNTSQIVQNETDQNLNHIHAVQQYMYPAGPGAGGATALVYPSENLSVDGARFASNWDPTPRSSGQSSSSHNVEMSHYQPDVLGPSHDPYMHMHLHPARNFSVFPENSGYHASFPNYERPALIEGSFVDHTMSNRRGPYKRKSPGVSSGSERGSSSGYCGAGSSSDAPMLSDPVHEKPNLSSQSSHWNPAALTCYAGESVLFDEEGDPRNVRSRSAADIESNTATTPLVGNPANHPYQMRHLINHCSSMDPTGSASSALNQERNHIYVSPGPHGMNTISGQIADCSGLNHGANHFTVGSNVNNASVEVEQYHNDGNPSRNLPIPQNFHGSSTPPPFVRGVRSSYLQRTAPAFRDSSNSLCLGRVWPTSDENLQLLAEDYSLRHPRSLSSSGWRNSERNGRTRISHDRYRAFAVEAGVRDRLASEGLVIADQSALYGSRTLFDQHRDMRLDIDDMTYEELLALGERIGNVSTGLSEDSISKCLTETIYCSSDDEQVQENGLCAICLEKYQNMDDVRRLISCGHNYHVGCIRKWLSMKNSCPICKGYAMPDSMKDT